MNAVRHIPRIIHQCHTHPESIQKAYHDNIDLIKAANPAHEYRFYDGDAMFETILAGFGRSVADQFEKITSDYGAAKADFFRYCIIYKMGGIYLDLKSTATKPFDEVLHPNDQYILSQWRNDNVDLPYYRWGLYKELADLPRGEYQQWHVIAAPGHAFLEAVINLMLERLAGYTPWLTGYGHLGVIRTTGPITYTQAIEPIKSKHSHRLIHDETAIGLRYSIFEGRHDHRLGRKHYGDSFSPVVRLTSDKVMIGAAYLGMKQATDVLVRRPMRRLVHYIRAR